MIEQVQRETNEAVQSMQLGTEQVEEGMELADRTGDALERIAASTQEIEDMISQIATASEEQSVTSEQISESVEGISTVTQESAMGVTQIAESADGLGQLTEELRTLISRFRLGAESASAAPQFAPADNGHRDPEPAVYA